jgi:hypothetical protein
MMNSFNNSASVGHSRPDSRGATGYRGPAQAYQQSLLNRLRPNSGIFSTNLTPALSSNKRSGPTLVTYISKKNGINTPGKSYTASREKQVSHFDKSIDKSYGGASTSSKKIKSNKFDPVSYSVPNKKELDH